MADILLDNQSAPTTPASGTTTLYVDTTTKMFAAKNDAAQVEKILQQLITGSTAQATGFATDTYLGGSAIAVPNSTLVAGVQYRCTFDMTKTNVGVQTPLVNVRFGTAGTTADSSRCLFTFAVGTTAIDTGIFDVVVSFRSVGSGTSAVISGMCRLTHHLAATGLTTTGASGTGIITNTGGGFDSTVASSIIGVSFNGGTSFSGTLVSCQSQLNYSCI